MLDLATTTEPLRGYRVGLTASRADDRQRELFGPSGVACVHAPMTMRSQVDSLELASVAKTLCENPPDLVIATTADGVALWLQACDSLGVGKSLRDCLVSSIVIACSARVGGALAAESLPASVIVEGGDAEVIRHVGLPSVGHRRVAIQLDGSGSVSLCRNLRSAGYDVVEVPVYELQSPTATDLGERLVQAVGDLRLDGLTFISPADVDYFFRLARTMDKISDVERAFRLGVVPFCIDDRTAAAFSKQSKVVPFLPERPGLGDLVFLVGRHLESLTKEVVLGRIPVRLQGSLAVLEGVSVVELTERERSLLQVLLSKPGAVHSKRSLLSEVWNDSTSDQHVVEVAIARLRRRLGRAGEGIETIVRRGYRVRSDR